MYLTNCTILPSAHSGILKSHYIHIDKNIISDIGEMNAFTYDTTEEVVDIQDKLVIPGLINAHNHCAMTLYRGLADDLDLHSWLHDNIFPAEASTVSEEMVYWCTKLAAAEMVLSGTTCVADGYFFSPQSLRALADSSMRGIVAHGIVDFPAPSVPDPSKNIESLSHYLDTWQGKYDLVSPAIFAHAPYTCSPKTLTAAKKLANRRGCRFFIHIAESKNEQGSIIDPQGPTPVQHLAALNILDSNTVLIHAVWLDETDFSLIRDKGCHVVLCPQSNMKLASGIADGTRFLQENISTGLGTDGCASNNGLDMFREMRTAALLQKAATADATSFSARQVLQMASTANAKILGLSKLGKVKKNYLADLVVIDTNRPELTPFYSQDILVYGANGHCVNTVMINGKIVVQDQKLTAFDLEETIQKVNSLASTIQ